MEISDFSKKLIESLPIAYSFHQLIVNAQGEPEDYIFLDVNAAFEKMTGLQASSIMGKRVTEVLPGIRTGSFDWIAFYGKVALTGETQDIIQYADMLGRWYKITVYSPDPCYFVTVFFDITAEYQDYADMKTQKNEIARLLRELETVFNSTHDALSLIEYNGSEFRYIRSNLRHREFFGYDVITGKTPVEMTGEAVGNRLVANYRKCVESGKPYSYEMSDSETGQAWISDIVPVIEAGKVKYLVSSIQDVSELRSLEKKRGELIQRLESMFDRHSTVMFILNPETGKILDANPAACSFYGYSKQELLDMYISDIDILPADEVQKLVERAAQGQQKYFVFQHRLKNGEVRFVDVYSCPITDGNGTEVFSISFDVTEREELRTNLNNEKELLRITLNSIGDGVVTTDIEGRITALNEAASQITGWSEEEARKKHFSDVFQLSNEETGQVIEGPISLVLSTGQVVGMANHTVLTNKAGDLIPLADSAAPIRDENNNIFGVVMVFRDVSTDKAQREQILYLSYHDSLTSLYNRRYIEEALVKLDKQPEKTVSAIMGDVNGLKLANDIFGHEYGDALLKAVSKAIMKSCREGDIAARWGGDEFLILLPDTDYDAASAVMQAIKQECDKETAGVMQLSISLGCSERRNSQPIHLMLQVAEERMYHQKLLEGRSYRNSIINTLRATIFEKSYETETHGERIKKLCQEMGLALKLRSEEISLLMLIAMLHDIGKVGIPEKILKKPGPLTEEEWKVMRTHPEIGYRITQYTPELSIASEYILSHHERWDGRGYPYGTAGEDIPLLCRILAIIDAYDAMTNNRVYRNALSEEEALEELKRNAGTQFDPKLVEVFLSIRKKHAKQ